MLKKVFLAAGVLIVLFAGWLFVVWPPAFWWRSHWPRRTAFMAMRERQYADSSRPPARDYQPIGLGDMSPWLPKAAIAGEDEAFYVHHGIDWHAIREAVGYRRNEFDVLNPRDRAELERALGHAAQRKDKLRGASTITQQLAKNLYLSPSRNPLRKLKEAVIAYQLEWFLPKDRIMALYLNVAEFGPNLWGVEAASRRYFHRDAERLTMDQAAELIATLPHPITSNPAHRPGRTEYRAQLILRKLRGENVDVPPTGDTGDENNAPADSIPPAPALPAPISPDTAGVHP